MKIKKLVKQLGEYYPEPKDYNYDSLISDLSQSDTILKRISYGENSSPITKVNGYNSAAIPGFEFITNVSKVSVTYGPKVRKLLIKDFRDFDCITH